LSTSLPIVPCQRVRSPTSARCAAKPSARVPTSSPIVGSTRASSPLAAICVAKASREKWICGGTERHFSSSLGGLPSSCPRLSCLATSCHVLTKQEARADWPAFCRTSPKGLGMKMERQG
uniref:Uncharacterized protein n=1 Tax=Podarcis muralis TaxID=64176 RepID=A0A670IHH7_PODMU